MSSSMHKRYILEFWYRWPKARLILRPLHTYMLALSQWEEIKMRLFWANTILSTLSHRVRVTGKLDILNRKIANQWSPPYVLQPRVHLRSWKVPTSFSAITFDRDKLERWKHLDAFRSTIRIAWYAIWPFSVRSWPWHMVKFSKLPFHIKLPIVHSSRLNKGTWERELAK